jgi:hypothetical protein
MSPDRTGFVILARIFSPYANENLHNNVRGGAIFHSSKAAQAQAKDLLKFHLEYAIA